MGPPHLAHTEGPHEQILQLRRENLQISASSFAALEVSTRQKRAEAKDLKKNTRSRSNKPSSKGRKSFSWCLGLSKQLQRGCVATNDFCSSWKASRIRPQKGRHFWPFGVLREWGGGRGKERTLFGCIRSSGKFPVSAPWMHGDLGMDAALDGFYCLRKRALLNPFSGRTCMINFVRLAAA